MNNKLATSFIPKQAIGTNRPERREPLGLVTLVAVIIFAIAALYFAGIFAYRFYVYNQINRPCPTGGESFQSCGLRESLEREKKDFQYESLARLKRLDTKLKNGSAILAKHQTLRPLFELLSKVTAHNVQFNDFKFNKNVMEARGLASSYEDVAYQSKILTSEIGKTGEERKITAFSFSNFDLDNKGNVTFNLTLTVDPSLLLYVKHSQ